MVTQTVKHSAHALVANKTPERERKEKIDGKVLAIFLKKCA